MPSTARPSILNRLLPILLVVPCFGAWAAPGDKQWEADVGSYVHSTPAIGQDWLLYVTTDEGTLHALDAETGARAWEFGGLGSGSSPAVGPDGTVYVGSQLGTVYALDGSTGRAKWEFSTGGRVQARPAVGSEGTVYVGSADGKLYALDGASGALRWTFQTGDRVVSSAAVAGPSPVYDPAQAIVYFGSRDHHVYAVRAASGEKQWSFPTGGVVDSSPALGPDGTVYVGSADHKVYALQGATGTQKWTFETGGEVLSSPAIGPSGLVYVGSSDYCLYALEPANGSQKWKFATGGETSGAIRSSPAVGADGTVYVGSWDRKLYALDGATGAKKWDFDTGAAVLSSPLLGLDRRVVIGTGTGKVYALETASGLAPSYWPRHGGNPFSSGCNLLWATLRSTGTTVFQEGTFRSLGVVATGWPTPTLQWNLNGHALPGAGLSSYPLAPVTRAHEGTYTVAASNDYGSVTTEPAVVVVSNVEPLTFMALMIDGGIGQVEFTAELGSAADWQRVPNAGYYQNPPMILIAGVPEATRFYRLVGEDPLQFTGIAVLSGWTFTQAAGTRHLIEYVEARSGWTNWQPLTTLRLPYQPYFFLDLDSARRPQRIYRTTPVP